MIRQYKCLCIMIAMEAIVLILLLVSYVIRRNDAIVYSPGVQNWQSRMLSYEDGWQMTGEAFSEIGYAQGENVEIIYGPYLSVPKGDYTLRITYECDSDQAFRVYSAEMGDSIWPQSDETLDCKKRTASYNYYLNDAIKDLEVRICFDGIGTIHIQDISLASGWWRPLENIIIFSILFFITDILFLVYKVFATENMKCMLLSFISSLALVISPQYVEKYNVADQVAALFIDNRWLPIVISILLYCFYRCFRCKTKSMLDYKRDKKYVSFLATLCSFFLIIGYSFQEEKSWDLVLGPRLQIVKSYIMVFGLSILFYNIIMFVYSYLDEFDYKSNRKLRGIPGVYLEKLRAHPFLISFVTVLLFSIPYMVISYPALFVLGDTDNQIAQAFGVPLYGAEDVIKKNQGLSLITQHHPVFHTLLIHSFLVIGMNVLNSANAGLFMMALFQAFLTIAAISFLIKTVVRENASDAVVLVLLCFFCFCPCIRNYLFLLSKDVIYAALTLLSIVLLWKLIMGKECGRRTKMEYVACLLGILIMRNEGIYIIILQMIIYMFTVKRLKKMWGGL